MEEEYFGKKKYLKTLKKLADGGTKKVFVFDGGISVEITQSIASNWQYAYAIYDREGGYLYDREFGCRCAQGIIASKTRIRELLKKVQAYDQTELQLDMLEEDDDDYDYGWDNIEYSDLFYC